MKLKLNFFCLAQESNSRERKTYEERMQYLRKNIPRPQSFETSRQTSTSTSLYSDST
jgi:hypothetical protein